MSRTEGITDVIADLRRTMTQSTVQERHVAEDALRQSLALYGDTKHSAVADAISVLAKLNPTPAPAHNTQLRDGNWLMINAPTFPGGQRCEDGTYLYSMGRLAFNMFQPKDLLIKIDRVVQPVLPIPNSSQRTHDVRVEFSTVNEANRLQGIVTNRGVCEPCADDTLQVQYTGGNLEPKPGTDLQTWNATFGNQSNLAKSTFKEKLMNLSLKLMFGLVASKGINHNTGEATFTMTRSPKRKLEILYLDDYLRITRGSKGTVLVCERQDS